VVCSVVCAVSCAKRLLWVPWSPPGILSSLPTPTPRLANPLSCSAETHGCLSTHAHTHSHTHTPTHTHTPPNTTHKPHAIHTLHIHATHTHTHSHTHTHAHPPSSTACGGPHTRQGVSLHSSQEATM